VIALLLLSCRPAMVSSLNGGDDTLPIPRGETSTAPTDTVSTGPTTSGSISAPTESIPDREIPQDLCHMALTCEGTLSTSADTACWFSVEDSAGAVHYSGDAVAHIRGRSSSGFPKPQYAVELRDPDGEEVEADLMGLGDESDWVLGGAWIDRALIRNPLGFDTFQSFQPGSVDRYAAQIAFCDLTLDGDWFGIYHLTEKIKRDDDRLDLERDDSGQTFIVKLDDEDGVWANGGGTGTWQLVYPRDDTISAEANAAVQTWLAGWEQASLSDDPADPSDGVFTWVDLDSSVDLVILEEFMRNNDGYYLSLYLWRRPGETMRWAPWDLDLTLSQPSYNDNENPEGWIAYRPSMIAAMGEDPEFTARLEERWWELREGALAEDTLDARITEYVERMGEDTIAANFETWPIDEVSFGWSGEEYLYEIESHEAELERIREWLPIRLAWIDANIHEW